MTTECSLRSDREEKSRIRKVIDRAFRKKILSQFKCICCDEPDSDLIDWHHVNPEEKLLKISSLNTAHDRWWDEVLKCVPVCVSCHRKIHMDKLCLLPIQR